MPARWLLPQNVKEAKEAQSEMAASVIIEDSFEKPLVNILGTDLSNKPFDPEKRVFGGAVLLSSASLDTIEIVKREGREAFPYVPGLLGFREVPMLVELYKGLRAPVDLIMVDGHGISHPRGLGVASHLGVLLDVPTIGVAKSILVGVPKNPLGEEAGSMTPLVWKGEEIGMLIRTKKRCSPLIISSGHKISLKRAIEIVFSCLKEYRLPEPTRRAHIAANDYRKSFFST
jgi:deoxyribonuclease V